MHGLLVPNSNSVAGTTCISVVCRPTTMGCSSARFTSEVTRTHVPSDYPIPRRRRNVTGIEDDSVNNNSCMGTSWFAIVHPARSGYFTSRVGSVLSVKYRIFETKIVVVFSGRHLLVIQLRRDCTLVFDYANPNFASVACGRQVVRY